ncbi:uncharacterized protein LOC111715029 [Eurytemora carolleeae]|uniref:uncharacterized protein LOC111715029 n=1 Tax=Eurytemora carolleeae TaxID=1294199 RepID=UPI000C75F181|nr:uncharacterized protein LOC111715029 [Eurytemora carolleeae]|eukprot:XP_023346032.1 uncharacterized protein LOC111715029 [Eurytemora affinis]
MSTLPQDVSDTDLELEYSSSITEMAESRKPKRRTSNSSSVMSRTGRSRTGRSRTGSIHTAISSLQSDSTYEALKLHREVLGKVKYQIWPLDRKLRVLQQAKLFLKKHQTEVESLLRQEKSFASYIEQGRLWLVSSTGQLLR